jgi:hypothetical protein
MTSELLTRLVSVARVTSLTSLDAASHASANVGLVATKQSHARFSVYNCCANRLEQAAVLAHADCLEVVDPLASRLASVAQQSFFLRHDDQGE